jgi:hypothetical protein
MTTKITSRVIAPQAVTAEAVAPGVSGNPGIVNLIITDSNYANTENSTISTSGGYIKLYGFAFSNGCQVHVEDTLATSVSFVSVNEVHSQLPAKSAGTYNVFLTNPNGRFAIKVNGITYQ